MTVGIAKLLVVLAVIILLIGIVRVVATGHYRSDDQNILMQKSK